VRLNAAVFIFMPGFIRASGWAKIMSCVVKLDIDNWISFGISGAQPTAAQLAGWNAVNNVSMKTKVRMELSIKKLF